MLRIKLGSLEEQLMFLMTDLSWNYLFLEIGLSLNLESIVTDRLVGQ